MSEPAEKVENENHKRDLVIKIAILAVLNIVGFTFVLGTFLNICCLRRPFADLAPYISALPTENKGYSEIFYNQKTRWLLRETLYFLFSRLFLIILGNIAIIYNFFVNLWDYFSRTINEKDEFWKELFYSIILITVIVSAILPLLVYYSDNPYINELKWIGFVGMEIFLVRFICGSSARSNRFKIAVAIIFVLHVAMFLIEFLYVRYPKVIDLKSFDFKGENGVFLTKIINKFSFPKSKMMFAYIGNTEEAAQVQIFGSKVSPTVLITNPNSKDIHATEVFVDFAFVAVRKFYKDNIVFLTCEIVRHFIGSILLVLMFSSDVFLSAFGVKSSKHPSIVRYAVSFIALVPFYVLLQWMQILIGAIIQVRNDREVAKLLGKDVVLRFFALKSSQNIVFQSNLFHLIIRMSLPLITRVKNLMQSS